MNQSKLACLKQCWSIHWQLSAYKKLFIVGIIFLASILVTLPYFFQAIERREGILINDWLLAILPAYDVSIPIFTLIWGTTILLLIRAMQNPAICITFLWSYILVQLLRLITIALVPLEAPRGLIELVDPISNQFYGGEFLTKDLFYSGHMATSFLMFLCFVKKNDRAVSLCATIVLGVLLLIQHVHYTLDVLAAPIFSYIIWRLVEKKMNRVLYADNLISV